MKKIFTCLCLAIVSFSADAQNPVPNPGFEIWNGTEPDYWLTINIPPDFPVTQTTPGNSGLYALKGEVISLGPGSQLAPFVASTQGTLGFPVTQLYSELTFWYKTFLQSGDELKADILFNDTAGNEVAAGTLTFSGSLATFTKATVPVIPTGGIPATCLVVFSLINQVSGQTTTGSYFIVDDVEVGSPSGIFQPGKNENSITLYPNPAKDLLHLQSGDLLNNQSVISICDLSGREVLQVGNIVKGLSHEADIDITAIPSGAYILQLTSGTTTSRKIFIKQ